MTETATKAKPKANGNLSAALLHAQRHMPNVPKDGFNQHHKYHYATAESMMETTRGVLHLAGLVLVPDAVPWEIDWQRSDEPGERTAMLKMRWVLEHPESGESRAYELTYPVIPDRGRPMDKAMSAAVTTCTSYFLRSLLLVPRIGAEGEVDTRSDSDVPAQRHVPRPDPTPPPAETKPAAAEEPPVEAPAPDASANGESESHPAVDKQFKLKTTELAMKWTGRRAMHTVQGPMKQMFEHLGFPPPDKGEHYPDEAWTQLNAFVAKAIEDEVAFADAVPT